jgi:hypothetical protein
MAFGTIGVAKQSLKEDGFCTMDQSRNGSDCCEHTFCSLRNKNPNPTVLDATQALGVAAGSMNSFRMKAKSNTSGAQLDPASLMALPQRRKRSRS